MKEPTFFERENMALLLQYGGREYDSQSQEHQSAGKRIRETLWQKSKYWAGEVAQRTGLGWTGKAHWQQRKNLQGRGIRPCFRTYTWLKLYRKGKLGKGVVFTVGLGSGDGRVVLFYKIDKLEEGEYKLKSEQIQVFEAYKSEHRIWDKHIPWEELNEWNWERLIGATVAFVQQNLNHYDTLVQRIWGQRIARICWNEAGWTQPSGKPGKSIHPSHEFEHGYGHDEWLFNDAELLDGYQYGFLQPVTKSRNALVGETLDLLLWTRYRGKDKVRDYWVGEIKELEVISVEHAREVREIFEEKGWLSSRKLQIEAVGGNAAKFSREPGENMFNVRFKPENIDRYDQGLLPFQASDKIPNHRYQLYHRAVDPEQGAPDQMGLEKGGDFQDKKTTTKKTFKGGEREYESIHNQLQNVFIPWLRANYREDIVNGEHRKKGMGSRIDVTRKTQEGRMIFYEIKSYANALTSVRIALGQLLEYAFYPDQALADELVIVSHKILSEEGITYLGNLQKRFGLSIGYICFDYKSGAIKQEINLQST